MTRCPKSAFGNTRSSASCELFQSYLTSRARARAPRDRIGDATSGNEEGITTYVMKVHRRNFHSGIFFPGLIRTGTFLRLPLPEVIVPGLKEWSGRVWSIYLLRTVKRTVESRYVILQPSAESFFFFARYRNCTRVFPC